MREICLFTCLGLVVVSNIINIVTNVCYIKRHAPYLSELSWREQLRYALVMAKLRYNYDLASMQTEADNIDSLLNQVDASLQ
jgi:hypothetical protein